MPIKLRDGKRGWNLSMDTDHGTKIVLPPRGWYWLSTILEEGNNPDTTPETIHGYTSDHLIDYLASLDLRGLEIKVEFEGLVSTPIRDEWLLVQCLMCGRQFTVCLIAALNRRLEKCCSYVDGIEVGDGRKE